MRDGGVEKQRKNIKFKELRADAKLKNIKILWVLLCFFFDVRVFSAKHFYNLKVARTSDQNDIQKR